MYSKSKHMKTEYLLAVVVQVAVDKVSWRYIVHVQKK